jgi:low affinity Fe/Cu permease
MKMDTEDYIDLLSARAADARAMIMFFAVIHTGLLVVLGFAGEGLQDSGTQLALAAVTVLTSLWTVFFMDDCMQDLFAIAKDLPEDFQSSNVGRRFTAVTVPGFRVVNFAGIGLRVVAELLAIY